MGLAPAPDGLMVRVAMGPGMPVDRVSGSPERCLWGIDSSAKGRSGAVRARDGCLSTLDDAFEASIGTMTRLVGGFGQESMPGRQRTTLLHHRAAVQRISTPHKAPRMRNGPNGM